MADYVVLAKASEIPIGAFKSVKTASKRLLVCRTDEGYFVVDDTCTHDDGPLADGYLDGNAIECPRHGARFDVKTGKVLCLPAVIPIHSYSVRVEGDDIKAQL